MKPIRPTLSRVETKDKESNASSTFLRLLKTAHPIPFNVTMKRFRGRPSAARIQGSKRTCRGRPRGPAKGCGTLAPRLRIRLPKP